MKKVLLLLLLIFIMPVNAETLRGSVHADNVPAGFFGTWHVTSKRIEATDVNLFNEMSVDIWTLSAYGEVLVLENSLTGATSNITISSKSIDGKTLKFTRYKELVEGKYKTVHIESPEFVLAGKIFTGFDTFIVEKYEENKLIKKDVVRYKVIGQKI